MKKYILDWKFIICLLSFCIGTIIAFKISIPSFVNLKNLEILNHFNNGLTLNYVVFFEIFNRNLIVSFLLSIVSFVGLGILAPLIMFINGVYFGELLNFHGFSFQKHFLFFIFHGPIEIISFSIFGSFGLRGIKFYQVFFNFGWKLACVNIPNFNEFKFPIFLLFLAAIIESILIVNY